MAKKSPVANRMFWEARQRLGLSREQLADDANQEAVMSTCRHVPMTENFIGRIEQGRIGGGMCDERRAALCVRLEVEDPTAIGLTADRRLPTRAAPTRPRRGAHTSSSSNDSYLPYVPGSESRTIESISAREVGAGGTLVHGYDTAGLIERAGGDSPSADMADRADQAMQDALLTFTMTRDSRNHLETVDRLAELSGDTPPPLAIGWNDVNQVRFVSRTLALSENTFGGGFSGEAAAAQLRYSARLLDARAGNDVRLAMFEAVGNLSGVVGFSAFDVSNYRSARTCFEFELWCAEQAGSWALRASALSDLARLAIYLGELEDALSLIELAQVRSDRLTRTTSAMLSALRSRLFAMSGRYEEAHSELARSDEHFSERDPAQDPPWMSYYDEAEHQGSTGRALVPIAIRESDPRLAAVRMRRAIRLHDDDHPRSRALSRTRLASLLMKVGDPKEAASVGRTSLSEASSVRSTRLRAELERLAAVAATHSRISEVADLIHDITAA